MTKINFGLNLTNNYLFIIFYSLSLLFSFCLTQFVLLIMMQIKQQKDIFNRHCSLFLSNYIWVYSGYGPRRSGIRRLYISFVVYSFLFSVKFYRLGDYIFHHARTPLFFYFFHETMSISKYLEQPISMKSPLPIF